MGPNLIQLSRTDASMPTVSLLHHESLSNIREHFFPDLIAVALLGGATALSFCRSLNKTSVSWGCTMAEELDRISLFLTHLIK